MRTTEDRLFDRGWVRSAMMATRKCRNIYFPKYFMAVRPFFTRIFFQELFGLEGSKHFLENFVRCKIWKSWTVSYDPRVFFKRTLLVLYAVYVYPFWVVSLWPRKAFASVGPIRMLEGTEYRSERLLMWRQQQQTTYFVVREEGMGWGGKTLMEA